MMSRDSVEAMLSLPPAARRTNGLILTGIRIAWPELLDLPINRYGDWRDRFRLARRALSEPRLIVKKLRKRFG